MPTGMPFNLCSLIEEHYKAAMAHYATDAEAQQAIRLHENAGELLTQLEAAELDMRCLIAQVSVARGQNAARELRAKCDGIHALISKIKKG